MALIDELVGKYNKTILMVTHDPVVAARAHMTLHLEKVCSSKVASPSSRSWREVQHEIQPVDLRQSLSQEGSPDSYGRSFAVALFLFTFLAVVKGSVQPRHRTGGC